MINTPHVVHLSGVCTARFHGNDRAVDLWDAVHRRKIQEPSLHFVLIMISVVLGFYPGWIIHISGLFNRFQFKV